MQQYKVTLNGLTPLLMHNDNIGFSDIVKKWMMDPTNKKTTVPGDDRTPAWTWIGYLYHNTKELGIPSDNLMTMLREGGAKVPKQGRETFKKQSQSGIVIDREQFQFLLNNKPIPVEKINDLIYVNDFQKHVETIEKMGFELFVKRAKIGTKKHVRVRPLFRNWSAVGTITVLDEEIFGITPEILETIFKLSGALCGLGDWRPSSPSSGSFGKFDPIIEKV